ncbi:hypothetical protein RRG08_019026 [Elysia crispata]|uniref:Uncharacterized protein n=1 Tax=Elysia crispata TaxID=231223 RepID=A0AAE1A575_9GAST|nr:hypothetical protein RRG08_019026 [Elysia crispata]
MFTTIWSADGFRACSEEFSRNYVNTSKNHVVKGLSLGSYLVKPALSGRDNCAWSQNLPGITSKPRGQRCGSRLVTDLIPAVQGCPGDVLATRVCPTGLVDQLNSSTRAVAQDARPDSNVTLIFVPDDNATHIFQPHSNVTLIFEPDSNATHIFQPHSNVTLIFVPDGNATHIFQPHSNVTLIFEPDGNVTLIFELNRYVTLIFQLN